MSKLGLVLEGGGMRGVYTMGVLDYFMEHNLYTDGVIGVSAGACHACSYASKQRGRAWRINERFLNDKRYICLLYTSSPESGVYRPHKIFANVLFPAPFFPIIAIFFPRSTFILISDVYKRQFNTIPCLPNASKKSCL